MYRAETPDWSLDIVLFLKDLLTLNSSQVVQVSMSENLKYYLNILTLWHNGVVWWMEWCGDGWREVVIDGVMDQWSEVVMDGVKIDGVKWWWMEGSGDGLKEVVINGGKWWWMDWSGNDWWSEVVMIDVEIFDGVQWST